MKKMKKAGLLFLALLLSFSPARSEDSFWPAVAVAGTAAFFVGGIYYLINLPDYCPACDCSIKDGSARIRKSCGHDFHSECYNQRAICRYCEKQEQRARAFEGALSAVRDVQERQRLQDEYDRNVLAKEAKDAQQKEMQRLHRERQAAEERKNARVYQASRAQQEEIDRIARNNAENARRKQEEQDSERLAQSLALEESNKKRDAENREAARLQREEQARREAVEFQRKELIRRNAEKREEERKKQQQEKDSERLAQSLALKERNKIQDAENRRKNEEAAELQRQELARRNAENAQREEELKRQKQAQAAEKRQKDAENKRREDARVLQAQEIENAEQARIKSTGWMMAECVICQEPRAWDEQKNCLIDLTKPENKLHRVALPCGHVFHTKCIKEWAKTGNHTCPECRTAFKATDL